MASLNKEKPLDVEAYQRLLVTARSVAVSRPNNLIKFAEKGNKEDEGNQLKSNISSLQSISNVLWFIFDMFFDSILKTTYILQSIFFINSSRSHRFGRREGRKISTIYCKFV